MNRASILIPVLASAALCASLWPAAAQDKDSEAAFAHLNRVLLEQHVVPQHARFAAAARELDAAVTAFCAGPDNATLEDARAAFGQAVEGWAGVQHLAFAPQEIGMRKFRVQFWPDPKNRTGRRIAQYLRDGDRSLLEPDRFVQVSVTIQGLPALEHLLFEPESTGAILGGGEEAEARCALAVAVSANIDGIASGLLSDWQRDGGFREDILEPDEDGYFESHVEIANKFFSHLHDALELTLDAKLVRPMGVDPSQASGARAEYPRSGFSLASIAASFASARDMWSGVEGGFRALAVARNVDPAAVARIDALFEAVSVDLKGIRIPLARAVEDAGAQPALDKLKDDLQALRTAVRNDLSEGLQLVVGFNARDGD